MSRLSLSPSLLSLRLRELTQLGHPPAVIRNLPLLVASEGLRVVLQALADGPFDFAPYLALAFLAAVDHPETRQWLRPGVDVEVRRPLSPRLSPSRSRGHR